MSVQTQINKNQPRGMVGEIYTTFPIGATTFSVKNNGAVMPSIGLAFTVSTTDDSVAIVGGAGAFAGIAVNPKEHTAFNALLPTLDISEKPSPDGTNYFTTCALLKSGMVNLVSTNDVVYGNEVQFNTTTGALSTPAVPGTPDAGNVIIKGAIWASNNEDGEVAIAQFGGSY